MKSQTEQKVRQILVNVFKDDIDLGSIGLDEKFSELGLSSLNFMKAIVIIESEFDLEFEDEDLKVSNFENLGTLVEFVNSKLEIKKEVV